ncbi:MAG: SDR family NAD(P)-dependent oxidoreductase [Patescibacteria group bacterium]
MNILITGSTDGIGKLAAAKLATDGHTIYIHGRSEEKVSATVAELRQVTGNESVHGFTADLSDLAVIRDFAEKIMEKITTLDILINNAGVLKAPVTKTPTGIDLRFVVNYFAPYVLTNALLPLLKQSEQSRVINLSSAAQSPVDLAALRGESDLSDFDAYAQSKLALTMWNFTLAAAEPDLSVIAVNPGSLLNTNMVREGFGQHRASADVGADILYELATKHEGVTGKYFDNDAGDFGQAHPDAYDQAKIVALIAATKKTIQLNS